MVNNVLLVYVPSRKGGGWLPLGLLYVGSILEKLGIKVKILDLYLYDDLRQNDKYGYAKLREVINGFKPQVVGFGGIATSYIRTKELSLKIRKEYPQIFQIAGGVLSSINELLLTKTSINVVFHAETEFSLPPFIEKLNAGASYDEVPGISYLDKTGIRQNPPPPQIRNLDDLQFPPYHLVDVEKYFKNNEVCFGPYKDDMISQGLYSSIASKIKDVEYFFPVVTSRGCLYRCSFCFRQLKGYRKHSVDYVIRHIKFLKNQFGVNGFFFLDELFNSDIKWVMEFCDAIEKNNLKIVYKITGARVDRVSEEMLRRMRQTGCVSINYGQESGSDKILKEYRKGVSREENIKATLMTKKNQIYSTVQLVIGSPGETQDTIAETIDFLKKIQVRYCSINYLIPLPGAPIWRYVEEKNLIKDVEEYLAEVADVDGEPLVNLTNVPNRTWRNWRYFIKYKIDLYYAKGNGDFLDCLRIVLRYHLQKFLPRKFKNHLKKFLVYLLSLKQQIK